MANIIFSGFAYNNAGVAIQNAAIDLYDRNTVTPSRASTTSDANGYWTISHATQGRFDVQIVSGSTTRRRKYDDSLQVETLEVAVFRMRNPADTFEYDIVPAAITASRQLNLPLITATDTIAVLALAQTFLTGIKTFNSSILAIRNPADTFSYTIVGSAIVADRNLTVPLLTGNDTIAVLGLAQTFSAATEFSSTARVLRLGLNQAADASARMAATGQYFSTRFGLTDGGTIALDWDNGNVQSVTLAGNRTFTFANPKDGGRYIIILTQDATGSRTVTWPTIKWQGGSTPVLTTTANKKDIIAIIYDGTDYLGNSSLNH